MFQGNDRSGIVKPGGLVKRPERIQRPDSGAFDDGLLQGGHDRLVFSFAEDTHGGVAMPFVRMTQQPNEIGTRFGGEIEIFLQSRALADDAVDAAGRGIDLVLVVLSVGDVILVHVRHVDGTVGRVGDVDGTEGFIAALHDDAVIDRVEGRAARLPFRGDDFVVERIDREEETPQLFRHGGAVGKGSEMGEAHHWIGRRHHREISESVGIARRTELPGINALHQVKAALHVMPAARASAVVARVEASLRVEFETEGVAAAFGKNLEGPCLRMITPDHAALEVGALGIRRIEPGTHDTARGRAPLPSVKPAVGSPDETIGHRVGVFKSEA